MSAVAQPLPPPPPPSGPIFDFVRPFTFIFDDPRWLPKILLGGLFTLASALIVGTFFVYGYLARLVRNVIAGIPNPLPEWDDLGEYFSEGVRLFFITVIYAIPVIVLAAAVVVPGAILSQGDSESTRNLGAGVMSCVWCLIFPIGLALAVWMPAALLMAVVQREFSAAFEFSRILAFIRANLGNYLLAFVVWLIARFGSSLGFLLLCVGIFFTMFWAFCVAAYAFGQTYRLSSAR
ncbi:MAG TPA: DUF4013 domain-containing protein [Thermoanaerobaculia bacterium]